VLRFPLKKWPNSSSGQSLYFVAIAELKKARAKGGASFKSRESDG
jgi:hypothetical protein